MMTITTDYSAEIYNDGNNTDRYGLLVQSGLDDQSAAGPSTLVQFNDGDGTSVGSITFGSSATAYNTSSDRRLKENIVNTSVGINDLMQIQIRDFNWKADKDEKLTHGIIAQELLEIYPAAVTVFKEENRMMMVDYSKITPLIVKSIQDQQLSIEVITSSELLISDQIPTLNNQISDLSIQADTSITNLEQLKASIDSDLLAIDGELSNQAIRLTVLEEQMQDIDISLISTQVDELMNFMLAIEANEYIKINEPIVGDLILEGKLEAEETETGIITIKVVDENAPTIGTAVICPQNTFLDSETNECLESLDEDQDNIDDNTDNLISDGKTTIIKTTAVSEDSKIFVTIQTRLSKELTLMVTEIKEGKSFKAEIVTPTEEKVEFDWWVVEISE